MTQLVQCPACQSPHRVAAESAGKKVRCGKCEQVFVVPARRATPENAVQTSPAAVSRPNPRHKPRTEKRGSSAGERDRSESSRRFNRKPESSLAAMWIVLGLGGGILVTALFGACLWFVLAMPAQLVPQPGPPPVPMVQNPPIFVDEKKEDRFDKKDIKIDRTVKEPPIDARLRFLPWLGQLHPLPDDQHFWFNDARSLPVRELPAPLPNDQVGPLAPRSPLWAQLRQKVEQKRWDRSDLVNGHYGRDAFVEVPAEGALLTGVCCDSGRYLTYFQAIYLTAQGEKYGRAYGPLAREIHVVKARPGYAVGQITVRAGDLFDGFGITFMKVEADRLNPADAYYSPWISGSGGAVGTCGGDGRFLVGVHGNLVTQGGFAPVGAVATLGVVGVSEK